MSKEFENKQVLQKVDILKKKKKKKRKEKKWNGYPKKKLLTEMMIQIYVDINLL